MSIRIFLQGQNYQNQPYKNRKYNYNQNEKTQDLKLNRPLKRGRNQPVGSECEKSEVKELQTQPIVGDFFPQKVSVAEFIQRELNQIGLYVYNTQEDHSFFRALADQLWGEEEQYQHVLYCMYECLKQRKKEIVPSFTMPQAKIYLEKMIAEDVKIGPIEFTTASLAFGVNICIYRYQKPPYVLQYFLEDANTIYLSYHHKTNFGSIRTVFGVWRWKEGSILQQLRKLYQRLYKNNKNIIQQSVQQRKNYLPKPKLNNTVKTERMYQDKKKFQDKQHYVRKQDHQYIPIESLNKDLRKLGLKQKLIPADGNCLFRAIADQLQGARADHKITRRRIVNFVERQENRFGPFIVNGSFRSYIKRKKQDQVWGGLIELQAASLLFKVNIFIFEEGKPQRIISNFDDTGKNTIYLSYDGVHYNSVRRIDDDGRGPVEPPDMKILLEQIKTEDDLEHENNLEKVRQALKAKRLQEQKHKTKSNTTEESNFAQAADQDNNIKKQNLELNS